VSLSINRVTIAGNLTRNPEVKFLANEKAVASFSIACNRTWKNAAGEKQEETTFVECEAWGRTAELVGQYLKKGSPAYVEGRLKQETWDDKTDGKKRSKTKVSVDNVQFLGSKPTNEGEQQAAPAPRRPAAVEPTEEPPF
jgi:single-strand DNA-binding protein